MPLIQKNEECKLEENETSVIQACERMVKKYTEKMKVAESNKEAMESLIEFVKVAKSRSYLNRDTLCEVMSNYTLAYCMKDEVAVQEAKSLFVKLVQNTPGSTTLSSLALRQCLL